MLEYNADTPSLIIESGDLQRDWYNAKGGFASGTYQSNYIPEALKKFLTKIKNMCKSVAFVYLKEDGENVA